MEVQTSEPLSVGSYKSTRREAAHRDYEFFYDRRKRQEIFEIGQKLSDYLHYNNIHELVLVDRSARPAYVAVLGYWRAAYPDEKAPNIYFVNPKGFKNKQEAVKLERMYDMETEAYWKNYKYETPNEARNRNEINRDFRTSYTELLRHKNERVMLFDTCIHSGASIGPVLETMQRNGFTNVEVGVVHEDAANINIPVNFEVLDRTSAGSCYPFHHDSMTEKLFGSVRPTRRKDNEMQLRMREELFRVVNEQIENHRREFPRIKNADFEIPTKDIGPRQILYGISAKRHD